MSEETKKREREEDLPGNSYRNVPTRTAEKPTAREKKGRVQDKKKTIGERIADSFIATDKEEVKEFVIFDFLIPGIKSLVENIVRMILFGGKGDSRITRSRGESRPRYVEYSSRFDERRKRDDEYVTRRPRSQPELIFSQRSDAEKVLAEMLKLLSQYGRVTMKDFYNTVFDVSDGEIDIPTDYTMNGYGWYNLKSARVAQVRDGYLLELPRVEAIGR